MTKQEQINEMAITFCEYNGKDIFGDCDRCVANRTCTTLSSARILHKKGYRKLNDGDIIIHKDEKERTDEEIKWLMEHNAEVRKGHEKFLEDSGNIILTKEDMQKYAKDCLIGEVAGLDILNGEIARGERKAKEARKETAKEILQRLYKSRIRINTDYMIYTDDIHELADKYGVEVEE